jgi:hypothetical protein
MPFNLKHIARLLCKSASRAPLLVLVLAAEPNEFMLQQASKGGAHATFLMRHAALLPLSNASVCMYGCKCLRCAFEM